jgi:DNA-binding CsgD family transcriptional regulator
MPRASKPVLTPRQWDIVRLVVEGKLYRDIADDLGLSYESVRTYVARIRERLGLATKVDLAVWGLRNLGGKNGRAKPH